MNRQSSVESRNEVLNPHSLSIKVIKFIYFVGQFNIFILTIAQFTDKIVSEFKNQGTKDDFLKIANILSMH